MLNRFDGYTEQRLYDCLAAIANSRQQPIANGETASVPYQYSNVGAGLLGHLLQRKAQTSFEQLLVERICDPLEMGDTRISLTKEQKERLAHGYYLYDQLAPSSSAGCLPAYGGLRSSANDLIKLLSLHLNDKATTLAAAASFTCKPQFPVNDNGSVGLFWQIDKNSGTVWHGGTTTGFTSAMAFHKESGTAVVVLTNSKSVVITPLSGAILVAVRGGDPKPIPVRKRILLENKKLDSYTGTYQDKSKPFLESLKSIRTVTRDGHHLTVKDIGGNTFPLYPDSASSFFCKGEDIDATFDEAKDGKAIEFNLNLWGYRTKLTKVK
jgi:CubicO group peptidase (beta-lactamase class C family)